MIKSVIFPNHVVKSFKVFVIYQYWKLVNIFLRLTLWVLYKRPICPKKILIFRTGSIGDGICSIPAISQIRKNFPQARIEILSNTGSKNWVSLRKLLSETIYDGYIDYLDTPKSHLIRKLQKAKYDLVIQLPQTQATLTSLLRDAFFFRLIANIPSGFGWEFSTVKFWKQTQEKYVLYYGEIERLLVNLERNHLVIEKEIKFPLNLSEEDIEFVNNNLDELKKSNTNPFIGIVIGAKRPQNRWPIAYFRELIENFNLTHNILLIGGPEDKVLSKNISNLKNVYDLCGKFTPLQSGIALSNCVLCVSNDTGPMHLSYAFGIPVVSIFSSRDFPNKWFPPEDTQNIVLRNYSVTCSLCLSENCVDNICMKGIKPSEVISAVNKLLNSKNVKH